MLGFVLLHVYFCHLRDIAGFISALRDPRVRRPEWEIHGIGDPPSTSRRNCDDHQLSQFAAFFLFAIRTSTYPAMHSSSEANDEGVFEITKEHILDVWNCQAC